MTGAFLLSKAKNLTQNIYGLILNLYLRYKKYLASLSMLRHAVRNPLHIKTVKAKVFAFQCTFIVLAHIGDVINGKKWPLLVRQWKEI